MRKKGISAVKNKSTIHWVDDFYKELKRQKIVSPLIKDATFETTS